MRPQRAPNIYISKMFARLLQSTLDTLDTLKISSQPPKPEENVVPAQRILELQMECEEATASPELISQLVQLYAEAYDYYERQGSDKCFLYQKRMHHFLSKHSIQSLLNGKKGHLVARKQQVERKMQHALITSKDEAHRMLDKSLKKAEKTKKRIDKELNNQEQTLAARIQRRKSMSNKSTKTDNEDCFDDLLALKGVSKQGNMVIAPLKQRNVRRVFI